jgi:hypothetical protein
MQMSWSRRIALSSSETVSRGSRYQWFGKARNGWTERLTNHFVRGFMRAAVLVPDVIAAPPDVERRAVADPSMAGTAGIGVVSSLTG